MTTENNETPFGKGLSMSDNLLESIEQWVLPVYKGDDVASLVSDAKDKEDKADDLASAGKHEDAADLLRQAASHHDAAVTAYKRVGDGKKFGAHAREAARLRDKALDILDAKHAEGDIANEINKGGPGSGEHDGHPFRGNAYTNGVQSAHHHNTIPGTEHWGHGQHLTAASSHIAAGRVALAHGEYGAAMKHFNTAANHAAQASNQAVHGSSSIEYGHHAELLYTAAHHAGDAAEKASYLTNKHNEAVRLGRGATVVTRAQLLDTEAGRAAISTNNADRGGRLPDGRLIPEGRASDRVLTTAELSNAAQGARNNALAQSNLVGAADSAVNMARGLSSPTRIGEPARAVNQ